MDTSDEKMALSLRVARERASVSASTMARWIATGELAVIRIHGRVLVDPNDLRAFLEAHKRVGPRTRPENDDPPASESLVRASSGDESAGYGSG